MLSPWFGRRHKPAANAADASHPSLLAAGVDLWLRPLFSAEHPDLRFHEAIACPAGTPPAAAGRWRMLAARAGWLPWLDRMLVRRCLSHLRSDGLSQLRLLCRIDPDSLRDTAFVAELETLAAASPAPATRLAVAVGRTRLSAPARDALARLRDRGIAVAFRRIARHEATPAELRRLGFDIVQLELAAGARPPPGFGFRAVGLLLVVGHADVGPAMKLGEGQARAA